MNLPLKQMTAEEFAAWAERQELGRYELLDGVVVPINAETSDHALIKLNIPIALRMALANSGLEGQVYGDGMATKIADRLVHEPDSMVRQGPKLPKKATWSSIP